MNSQTAWGIAIRDKVVTFVRENNGATTKEIREKIGNEAVGQLSRLVETGQLIRTKRGYYEFQAVRVTVK